MTYKTIRKKRPLPARVVAEMYGVSIRTVKSWNSQTREDWIDEQAATREAVRAVRRARSICALSSGLFPLMASKEYLA